MGKKINVEQKILSANEEYARENSQFFQDNKKLCLNLISSPGSGKTTLLIKTIEKLQKQFKIGVIEGDVQTDIDAKRIRQTKAAAIQIETKGACHLSAAQIYDALTKLGAIELDIIFIENVGNLVCPSSFALGETAKIAVLSVAEGDDKPIKYPALFANADAVVINKIDLLKYVDFDIDRAVNDIKTINKNSKIFQLSAKTNEGLDLWCQYLSDYAAKCKQ